MNKYYVYIHRNPITKEIFYVGLGYGSRAWNQWAGRNKFWNNYVNKHGFEVEILVNNITRKQAEEIEIEYISKLGRRQIDENGILVNRSLGGDGSKGYTHTEEYKKEMSEKRKNKCTRKERKLSEETKLKISNKLKEREINWGRAVLQYDKQGNFIKEWSSLKEAKKITGARSIFEVASGYKNQIYKTSGGFIWKYK